MSRFDDFRDDRSRSDWRDRDERSSLRDDQGRSFGGRDDGDEWHANEHGWGGNPPAELRRDARDGEVDRDRVSNIQDDQYRSWRAKHIAQLDEDYAAYCRERGQRFQSDFDSWRTSRRAQPSRDDTLELRESAIVSGGPMAEGGAGAAPDTELAAEGDSAPTGRTRR